MRKKKWVFGFLLIMALWCIWEDVRFFSVSAKENEKEEQMELTKEICLVNEEEIRKDSNTWYQEIVSLTFPSDTIRHVKIQNETTKEYLLGKADQYEDGKELQQEGQMEAVLKKLNQTGIYLIWMAQVETGEEGQDVVIRESEIRRIQVDADDPGNIQVITGYEGEWTNQDILIQVQADDTGSGIKSYEYAWEKEELDKGNGQISQDGAIVVQGKDKVISNVYVRAVDCSGRIGNISGLKVKYDSESPDILSFQCNPGKQWAKEIQFQGHIREKSRGAGIQSVCCKVWIESTKDTVEFEETLFEKESKQDRVYDWEDKITLAKKGSGQILYQVTAKDFAGNETVKTNQKEDKKPVLDQTIPEEKVYVSYGDKKIDSKTEIFPGIETAKNRFFFISNKIRDSFFDVYLYGRDGDSIVDRAELAYVDDNNRMIWSKEQETEKEGGQAVWENIEGVLYNCVHFRIPLIAFGEKREGRIQIVNLTDGVGNIRSFQENGLSKTRLVEDRSCPELKVKVSNLKSRYGDQFYFQKDGEVLYSIENETYFEEGVLEARSDEEKVIVWEQRPGTKEYEWRQKKLPDDLAEEKKEIVITYQDANGNTLCLADEDDELAGRTKKEGVYRASLIFDDKAPVLKEFSMQGRSAADLEDLWYCPDKDGGVEGQIKIQESYLDLNHQDVLLKAVNQDLPGEEKKVEIQWVSKGDDYEGNFRFDREGKYRFVLLVRDKAHNVMIADKNSRLHVEDGVFWSPVFVIDHTSPVLEKVTYQKPDQVTDLLGNTINATQPQADTISYYQSANQIEIQITETNFFPEDVEIAINGEKIKNSEISWKQEGDCHTGSFWTEKKDGQYHLTCAYEDRSGLAFQRGSQVKEDLFDWEASLYLGPIFVIDTIDPVVRYIKKETPVQTVGKRSYYEQKVCIRIVVQERNFRVLDTDLQFQMTAKDVRGQEIKEVAAWLKERRKEIYDIRKWKQEGDIWTFDLLLSEDANYTCEIGYRDLAGRKQESIREEVTVDTKKPYVESVSFWKADTGEEISPIPYLQYQYFSKDRVKVELVCRDLISGISQSQYYVVEDEKRKEIYPVSKKTEKGKIYLSFLLPQNFKGYLGVRAVDFASNVLSDSFQGVVSEKKEKHQDTSVIEIEPEKKANTNGFYQASFDLQLKIKDLHSGIKKLTYQVGSSKKEEMNYETEAKNRQGKNSSQKIVYTWAQKVTLNAKDNNHNHVKVKLWYEDNAGHVKELEKEYKIDVTSPVAKIEYDNHSVQNGKYYKENRIAMITVTEKNFDEKDFQIRYTSTGSKPVISSWKNLEGEKHCCTVTFREDGDYTLSIAGKDQADHPLVYDRVDEFTIDKTKPVLSVSYSNNEVCNQFYYKEKRTAYIRIKEKNFDEKEVKVKIQGKREGKTIVVPKISQFQSSQDENKAELCFDKDGAYTWSMQCRDKAGNEARVYGKDFFIIDQTEPSIKISGVEQGKTYQDQVIPTIEIKDGHFDAEGVTVKLTGYKNGEKKSGWEKIRIQNGQKITFEDLKRKRELDDVYLLWVRAKDKAGNRKEKKVTFFVNRFGSIYVLDKSSQKWLNQYYIREEQDIIICEQNVNALTKKEIICSRDGDVCILKEGTDYEVKERITSFQWKEYEYCIFSSCFAREGTYSLSLYSEDEADNQSDNRSKDISIEFVVDKTKPMAVIGGVEDGERYQATVREITIDPRDNIGISEVRVHMNGKMETFLAKDLAKTHGVVKIQAKASYEWQKIYAEVTDVSGNVMTTNPVSFLLTDNMLVQFYHNKKAICFAAAGIVIACVVLLWIFWIVSCKKDRFPVK